MKARRLRSDFVSILEAIYSIELSAEAWLKQVISAASPALDEGVGVGGVLYRVGEQPLLRLDKIAAIGVPDGWIEIGAAVHEMPELQPDIKRTYETVLCADQGDLANILPNYALAGGYFKEWNILGSMILNGYDVSGMGACLHLFSRAPFKVSLSRRGLLTQMSTHLATGYRLQRRLAAADAAAPVEAVLTPRGRIEHVEKAAESSEARASLKEAVERRRWSQGRARNDNPERAVAAWRGLVTGRWTLVDRFEHDGQRYILARENAPRGRRSVLLSERENQVVALASLGRSNKLIAYELGLAHSTVRVLIARAAMKLGTQSRSDLLSRFRQGATERGI